MNREKGKTGKSETRTREVQFEFPTQTSIPSVADNPAASNPLQAIAFVL